MSETTIYAGAAAPDGRPLPGLFTGPGAAEAAWRWAAVLAEHRDVLEARGKAYRDGLRGRESRRDAYGVAS